MPDSTPSTLDEAFHELNEHHNQQRKLLDTLRKNNAQPSIHPLLPKTKALVSTYRTIPLQQRMMDPKVLAELQRKINSFLQGPPLLKTLRDLELACSYLTLELPNGSSIIEHHHHYCYLIDLLLANKHLPLFDTFVHAILIAYCSTTAERVKQRPMLLKNLRQFATHIPSLLAPAYANPLETGPLKMLRNSPDLQAIVLCQPPPSSCLTTLPDWISTVNIDFLKKLDISDSSWLWPSFAIQCIHFLHHQNQLPSNHTAISDPQSLLNQQLQELTEKLLSDTWFYPHLWDQLQVENDTHTLHLLALLLSIATKNPLPRNWLRSRRIANARKPWQIRIIEKTVDRWGNPLDIQKKNQYWIPNLTVKPACALPVPPSQPIIAATAQWLQAKLIYQLFNLFVPHDQQHADTLTDQEQRAVFWNEFVDEVVDWRYHFPPKDTLKKIGRDAYSKRENFKQLTPARFNVHGCTSPKSMLILEFKTAYALETLDSRAALFHFPNTRPDIPPPPVDLPTEPSEPKTPEEPNSIDVISSSMIAEDPDLPATEHTPSAPPLSEVAPFARIPVPIDVIEKVLINYGTPGPIREKLTEMFTPLELKKVNHSGNWEGPLRDVFLNTYQIVGNTPTASKRPPAKKRTKKTPKKYNP